MTKTGANILLTAITTLFVAVFVVSGFTLFSYYRTAHTENEQLNSSGK